ncbi:HAD family hydrolase [Halosegnis sp.]|uniref:HAD family hydrolase n=1 Tax=Halosegnis sp. TaxID=2864959 RepID=UPI0035D49FF5
MPVTFDLFGTLVAADRPDNPAVAVARELRERGVTVPDDWTDAYAEPHINAPDGAEVPLPAHVAAALASRGVTVRENAARRAVVAAFDPRVERCPGALAAVERARERGPVGLLSNCSVPELVRRSLRAADLWVGDNGQRFDAVVASCSCGWRKPDARAFETVANALDCVPDELVHIGDSAADAGVEAVGGQFVDTRETPLSAVPP